MSETPLLEERGDSGKNREDRQAKDGPPTPVDASVAAKLFGDVRALFDKLRGGDCGKNRGRDQEAKDDASVSAEKLVAEELAAAELGERGEGGKNREDRQAKDGPPMPVDASVAANLFGDARALFKKLQSGDCGKNRGGDQEAKGDASVSAEKLVAEELAAAELLAVKKPTISNTRSKVLHGSVEILPSHENKASNGDVMPPRGRPLTARSLADTATILAKELRDTPLAGAAKAFAGKAHKFAAQTSDRTSRCWFILAGKNLADAAAGTPQADAVSDVLLAAEAVLQAEPLVTSHARCSWIKWLKLAITPEESQLPVHASDEEAKLIGKRQILYALALAAPVPLLTSAAGLQLFPGAWALVAGVGIAVWIVTTCGMTLNQYGRLDWEKQVAGHLGRLGILSAALVFSFYGYRAFFPSAPLGLGFLVTVAILSIGIPWVMSCIRGDDMVEAEGEASHWSA